MSLSPSVSLVHSPRLFLVNLTHQGAPQLNTMPDFPNVHRFTLPPIPRLLVEPLVPSYVRLHSEVLREASAELKAGRIHTGGQPQPQVILCHHHHYPHFPCPHAAVSQMAEDPLSKPAHDAYIAARLEHLAICVSRGVRTPNDTSLFLVSTMAGTIFKSIHSISETVKEERLRRINERQLAHALERSQRYLGRLEEVLVEGRNVKRPTQVTGRTRGNRTVPVTSTPASTS